MGVYSSKPVDTHVHPRIARLNRTAAAPTQPAPSERGARRAGTDGRRLCGTGRTHVPRSRVVRTAGISQVRDLRSRVIGVDAQTVGRASSDTATHHNVDGRTRAVSLTLVELRATALLLARRPRTFPVPASWHHQVCGATAGAAGGPVMPQRGDRRALCPTDPTCQTLRSRMPS